MVPGGHDPESPGGPFRLGYGRRGSGERPWPAHARSARRRPATCRSRQRPPVARTMASAIARPSPAPLASRVGAVEAVEDRSPAPRRGMPGPGVVDGERRTRGPSRRDGDVDRAALRRVLAGVVEEDAEQPVEQIGRRRRSTSPPVGAWTRSVRRRVSAMCAKRSAVCAASTPRSTGSASGGRCGRVEAGQPEHVLEQPAHPLRSRGRSARTPCGTTRRRDPAPARGSCAPR